MKIQFSNESKTYFSASERIALRTSTFSSAHARLALAIFSFENLRYNKTEKVTVSYIYYIASTYIISVTDRPNKLL